MVLIGITGPTGAGKTTLLREVEALGGAVIDCDAVYHELLEHDPILQHELERRFGPLRGENGSIDRKRLGAIVFGDPEKLAQLNAVAQTATVDRTRALVEECRRQGRALAAIDAIALVESGLDRLCLPTVAVTAPPGGAGAPGSWPGRGSRRTTPGPGCGPRSRRSISAGTAAMFW